MLNWIAIWVGVWLFGLGGPLQNPDTPSVPISSDVTQSAKLPVWWGNPNLQGLHIGLFIALAVVVVFWVLLNRSTTGYEVRAVGFNPEAARYGGMNVARNYVKVMAICGIFAGLAGGIDILGWQFRLATTTSRRPTSASWGSRSRCSGATRPVARSPRRCSSARSRAARRSATSTPSIFDPQLAQNLTLIIQGLIVLIVSTDVIALRILRRGGSLLLLRRKPEPAAEKEAA